MYVKREGKRPLELITNDLSRSVEEISELYKQRWQIELFFKWVKQNLKIKKFIGRSENAVKTQICIAFIVYLLLSEAEEMKEILSGMCNYFSNSKFLKMINIHIQEVSATLLKNSLGDFHPKIFILLLLIQFSILLICSSVILSKLVPLGKNLLIKPLIFSTIPFSKL